MLEAFILGFWTIWSSNRDIYALTESLGFMILVVLLRTAIAFQLPHIDLGWGISMGLLWAYVGLSFWVVNRFATSFMTTLGFAMVSAIGYFQLSVHVETWVAGWLA